MAVRTDFVAGEVLAAQDLDDTFAAKVDYALPVNTQTGTTYTFVLADGLRLTTASNASASTFTIPPQSSVVWLANSVIRLVNFGAGVVTFAGGSGVTVTNAAKTLAQFESAACIRTGSNAWTVVPFSGGVGNANFSDAATGTYTDGGIDYKFITFNSSGSLTCTVAGLCDLLIVGGGGSGGASSAGGGGAGGHLSVTDAFLPTGSLTVTVGAGGAGVATTGEGRTGNNGIASSLGGIFFSPGGGAGAGRSFLASSTSRVSLIGLNGSSGGGSGPFNTGSAGAGGAGISGLGNSGGQGNSADSAGGGGGGSAGGTNASSGTGGAGGAGSANSITGTSVTRCGGGGGRGDSTGGAGGTGGGGAGVSVNGNGTSGVANTGGGGGGAGGSSGNTSGAGGSGVVIIRVRTN